MEYVNPNSLKVTTGYVEPSLLEVAEEERFQFQRIGYFCVDRDSRPGKPVFNKTVGLRDTWAKIQQKK